ncbi:MAG: tRNA pseudouridine(55) synthase TruB [Myxococcota bacterium]
MAKRRRDRGPTGVLWIDKPAGPTSAEVCDFLRWVLRTRAVGHCGTLDPDATGLLVCCVGAGTKLVPELVDDDKRYRAIFALGRSTTTADAAGDVLDEAPLGEDAWAAAPSAVQGLRGAHRLSPPAFSAVRVDGERAHEKARRGEVVEVPARDMVVHAVEGVRPLERGRIEATLSVSKGSFIRSFAEELGRRLGVPAHLAALHRVGSGRNTLEDPRALSGFDVHPLDPRPDGKPRHRIRLRGVEDTREAQAAAVMAGLISPIEALALPCVDASRDAHGADLAMRLGFGQAVAADHPALREGPRHGRIAVTRGQSLVLARWAGEGDGAELRVDRTIVGFDRSGDTSP